MTSPLEFFIDRFRSSRDARVEEGEELLDALIAETDETVIASLFTAWNRKGITEDEIFAIADVLRNRCTRVLTKHEAVVDVVGTGGSKGKTFNVSTAAAFVVAGTGIPVAKHGNRAATSKSGSADVLGELGIEPAVDGTTAERCLDQVGICFMYAPNFHRLSPTLAKVRRGLGFPTIFNCVGPLANPANASHQLIGVWSESMVTKMASALARLGTGKSWVVHGGGGLDEISLDGETLVAEIVGDAVETFRVSAADFGAASVDYEPINTGSVFESAEMIRDVLAGRRRGRSAEAIVCVNAAAAIRLYGRTTDLKQAFEIATESIRTGAAVAKLEALREAVSI